MVLTTTRGPHAHEFGERQDGGSIAGPDEYHAMNETSGASIGKTIDEGEKKGLPCNSSQASEAWYSLLIQYFAVR